MRNKITFEQRVQVLLDKDEAKQVDGRTGPEYMRVCDHDQSIIFAPPALEAAIQAAGAKAGDVIQIDRLTRGKQVEWSVGIVGDTSQPASRTAAPAPRAAAPPAAAARPAGPAIRSDAAEDAAAMAAAFAAAIIATGEAEQHAARAGVRDLRLSDKDTICKLAITIYTGRQKAGAA